jgi:DegV family protein with EDD domain
MIHLVTDTTAYLPPELLDRWRVHVVPLKVNLGEECVDEDKISQELFFDRLKEVETAPSTSQPALGEFMRLYERLTANGDEVLSIHISEGLSGTARVALIAAQEVAPNRISVVDSRSATCGLALMIHAAAQALDEGVPRVAAAKLVRWMTGSYAGIFLVENLEYLAKGGRINGAARLMGQVLQLRPILHMNDGKIDALTVTRTRRRGQQVILDRVAGAMGDGPVRAFITHIQSPGDADALAERARVRLNCVDLFINETGPVIGSHVGPGFLGLAACPVSEAG